MEETMAPTMGKARARWTRFAVLGFVMIALGPALMVLGSIVWGLDLGDLGFFVAMVVIPIVGALVVSVRVWWVKFFAILAALLPLGGMFWTAFGLTYPQSFFDFVPGLLIIPGAVIAIIGTISSAVAGRRGNMGAQATGGERGAILTIIGLVAVLAIVSGILTYTGRTTSEATGDQTIAAKDFAFTPDEIEADGGETIIVRNDDPFFHTFTIAELDINQELTPGDRIAIVLPDEPGTYIFYCTPHTSEAENPTEDDMAGTLSIE